jgi:hypothetical protein
MHRAKALWSFAESQQNEGRACRLTIAFHVPFASAGSPRWLFQRALPPYAPGSLKDALGRLFTFNAGFNKSGWLADRK